VNSLHDLNEFAGDLLKSLGITRPVLSATFSFRAGQPPTLTTEEYLSTPVGMEQFATCFRRLRIVEEDGSSEPAIPGGEYGPLV
jgi:hypothetical protein